MRSFGMALSGAKASTPVVLTAKYPAPLLVSPPAPSWIEKGSERVTRRAGSKRTASRACRRWKTMWPVAAE